MNALSCKREPERKVNIKNPSNLEATTIKKVEVEVLGLVVKDVVVPTCWLLIVITTSFSTLATSAKTLPAMSRLISQKVLGLWKFT